RVALTVLGLSARNHVCLLPDRDVSNDAAMQRVDRGSRGDGKASVRGADLIEQVDELLDGTDEVAGRCVVVKQVLERFAGRPGLRPLGEAGVRLAQERKPE